MAKRLCWQRRWFAVNLKAKPRGYFLSNAFNGKNSLVRVELKTDAQKRLAELVSKKDIVFAVGPAGTGKTYVSMALAIQHLQQKDTTIRSNF